MEEKNTSYSIYIDRRPHKTLYLFKERQLTLDHIDQIIEYNVTKWGGRYNFLLPIKNNKISDPQWQFLKRYDPDFVQSYIPINKKLAIDLDTKITPLQVVDQSITQRFSPMVDHDGISILPTPRNIRQVSNAFGSDVYIVLFDINECIDDSIKMFILRNFGTLDLRNMANQALNQYPNKLSIKITDKQSFIDAMKSFNDFKPYVFPIQLCSIGDYIDDDRSIDNENNFYIFVGDSALDLLDWWNNPFYLQSWTRTRLRQIWIPTAMAEDQNLSDSLKKFIHGRADPYGHGQKRAVFSSRTVPETRLTTIASALSDGTWLFKETRFKTMDIYPNYSEYFSFDRIKIEMTHLRGTGKEEKIIVPPPDIEEGVMGGQHWMNDLYIQVPEKKVVPVNFETWLQLPRNNSVAQTVVSGLGRMTKNGVPSVLTSRSNQFHPNAQDFTIKFPSTWEIFASMIMNTGKPCFTNDARAKYIKPYKHDISISSAGKHIHGFLEVFGSLEGAYQIFEERHWRILFDLMANVSQEKEEKRLNDIKVRLQKKVTHMASDPGTLLSGQFVEWFSREIQKTAKMYIAANPKAVGFTSLEKIAQSELAEYNSKHPTNKFKYSKKEVLESFRWLTDSGAVLIGYELMCPSCLSREWRALGDVDQTIECRGCGHQYPFSPETEIRFKLNSIVENGVRIRGVVPVVLSLGNLFREARNYFDFMPPVDIYKKNKHLTDLDICCVIDGKFVIGEVKAQQDLFHPSDFQKITLLAKEIHPDKVVFSSLDKTILQRIKDDVEKVKIELAPYGIEVEWLYFDTWLYEASPIH
jgi:hypothetical protein